MFTKVLYVSLLLIGLLGLPIQSQAVEPLPALNGRVLYSPAGRYTLAYLNREIQVWDQAVKKRLRTLTFEQSITDLRFTPDGKFLVIQEGLYTYSLWETQQFKRLYQIQEHRSGLAAFPFAISPDGQYLTVARLKELQAGNLLEVSLHVWHFPSQKMRQKIFVERFNSLLPGHFPSVGVAYHPLGRYLSVGIEWDKNQVHHDLMVYDMWLGGWVYWLPGAPPLQYSSQGPYFAFAAPFQNKWTLRLWHLPSNRLKSLQLPVANPPSTALSLSAKGKYLAYNLPEKYNRREIHVVHVPTLKRVLTLTTSEAVDTLSFSSDEKSLIVSSQANPQFTPLRYTLP